MRCRPMHLSAISFVGKDVQQLLQYPYKISLNQLQPNVLLCFPYFRICQKRFIFKKISWFNLVKYSFLSWKFDHFWLWPSPWKNKNKRLLKCALCHLENWVNEINLCKMLVNYQMNQWIILQSYILKRF